MTPAEMIAGAFHATYETLAPDHGYQTREASAVDWKDVPARNKALMVATVQNMLNMGVIRPGALGQPRTTAAEPAPASSPGPPDQGPGASFMHADGLVTTELRPWFEGLGVQLVLTHRDADAVIVGKLPREPALQLAHGIVAAVGMDGPSTLATVYGYELGMDQRRRQSGLEAAVLAAAKAWRSGKRSGDRDAVEVAAATSKLAAAVDALVDAERG